MLLLLEASPLNSKRPLVYILNVHSGQEFPAVVEFAPFQKISKKKLKKKDAKAGSIEEGTKIKTKNDRSRI